MTQHTHLVDLEGNPPSEDDSEPKGHKGMRQNIFNGISVAALIAAAVGYGNLQGDVKNNTKVTEALVLAKDMQATKNEAIMVNMATRADLQLAEQRLTAQIERLSDRVGARK